MTLDERAETMDWKDTDALVGYVVQAVAEDQWTPDTAETFAMLMLAHGHDNDTLNMVYEQAMALMGRPS